MVKNIPTIERSTKIRFGKNAIEDQAENTIVFNASNVELQANTPGAVYLSPIRFREDFDDPEIVLLMYNKQTGEITESGSSASTAVEPPLNLVTGFGNTTPHTVEFENPATAFVTESNVGIANSNPVRTLDVGSNLFVEDIGSNVLTVMGNTYIQNDVNIDGNLNVKGVFARIDTVNTSIKDAIVELGRGNTSSDLGLIMDRPDSNVTVGFKESTDELIMAYTDSSAEGTTIVPLTSKDLSVRVYGNVEANYFTGDGSLLSNIASNLQEITDNGNTTSNTVQFTNPDVGLVATGNVEASNFVATGNVEATYFIGDGSQLTGLAATLEDVVTNSNTTSNTVQFTNADVGIVATGNVSANYFIGDGSQLTGIAATLEDVVTNSNTTSNTIQFTNTDVGLVATGNIQANYFIGDGSQLSNVATTLQAITDNGNTTSNTIQFTNNNVSLTTLGNVTVGSNFSKALFEVVSYTEITPEFRQSGQTIQTTSSAENVGWCVSISGDGTRAVVGAPYNGTNNTGRVAVYDLSGSQWTQVGSDIVGQSTSAFLGRSLAISYDGSRIAIGNDVNNKVMIYELVNNQWSQLGSDITSTSTGLGYFGYAVALSSDGSRVVVGTWNDEYVEVYEWGGSSWAKIGSTLNGINNSDFGRAVDISSDGSRIVVGSSGESAGVGRVYIYQYNGSQWQAVGGFISGPLTYFNYFGSSVAISSNGSRVVVGGVGSATVNSAVRVYDYNGSQWQLVGSALQGTTSNKFGHSVAISSDGSRIVVGAYADSKGRVRMYELDNNQWNQIGTLAGVTPEDEYGWDVDVSGDGTRFIIGIPGTTSSFTDGAVKLYNYVTSDEATFFEVDNVNNRVGIMTDSPAYTLDVHGDANAESLVVTSNIGIGTTTPQYNLDIHGTANVDSITVTNSDVGIVATGNVEATYFIGNGSQLTGLVTDLESVANNGNTTSNTIQFTNPTTAFTTDLTSNVGLKLEQLANVNITTPQSDHLLMYDGSDWVNEYNIHNFIKVHNTTGSTLYKGNVVYIVDSFNNNVANVALAKSDSSSTMPAIGLVYEDILNGQEGSAMAYGKVQGIDTTGFTEGQTVYVSNTSTGNIMNTKPYGLTDQIQNVGICIKEHQTNGVVFVTGVGRSNDIPNAPLVTDPNYVYVNDQNNDFKKIEPSNLLTQLQTLQQVTDTSNTTSNTIQFTNTDVGISATGNVEANYFVGDGVYIPDTDTTVSSKYVPATTVSAEWGARFHGTSNDFGYSIHTDSNRNVFAFGYYNSDPFTLYNADGTAFGTQLSRSGSMFGDIFLAKYNTSGVVQWATKMGGTSADVGRKLSMDSDGNVLVTGYYVSNPFTLYNADGTAFGTTLSKSTGYDIFIAKYNTSGMAQWATRISGTGADYGYGISTDSNGNVLVTGNYESNPLTLYNADGTAFGTTLTNSGGSDVFIAKYNTSGMAQWATRIAGTSNDFGYSISTDSDGNVFAIGYYQTNSVTLYNADGTAFGTTLTNSGGVDVFIAKYNTSGVVQWATRIAGTGSEYGRGISTDSDGNVFVTGFYQSNPVTLYNADGTAFSTTLSNSGGQDVFIAKYNTSGAVQWATRIAGTVDENGFSITTDRLGNVLVVGYYESNPLTLYNARWYSLWYNVNQFGSSRHIHSQIQHEWCGSMGYKNSWKL